MPPPPILPPCGSPGCGHGIAIHEWNSKQQKHTRCSAFDNGRKCMCKAYAPAVTHVP